MTLSLKEIKIIFFVTFIFFSLYSQAREAVGTDLIDDYAEVVDETVSSNSESSSDDDNLELYTPKNGETIQVQIETLEAYEDVASQKIILAAKANCSCSGIASFYGPRFNGRKTANGEKFNQDAMTAAHRCLKFGTKIKVTHKGRSVIVRINDRGPYHGGRVIDLSLAAARAIGINGLGKVSLSQCR